MSGSNPLNKDPITGESGAHPVGTGVGATGGAVTGAVVGTLVASPVGTVVGAAMGAAAGHTADKGTGEVVNPKHRDTVDEHNLGTGVGAGSGAAGHCVASTVNSAP